MVTSSVASQLATVFAAEWPQLVATLRAECGSLDAAEDAAQSAFEAAAGAWERTGFPDRPGAWLLTTARRQQIDRFRRQRRFEDRREQLAALQARPQSEDGTGGDAQLSMIFGCCHRSLDRAAQTALTLRYVCGLSTAQIARAFLTSEATMAKRLVRAKKKIDVAGVPFRVPDRDQLTGSLDSVLGIIYLIFNEGYSSSDSTDLVRGDLVDEAMWLIRLVSDLLPDEPEARGLLALMLFTDARRAARVDDHGDLVLLEDQDRSLWDADLIAEGHRLLESALRQMNHGPYQLQAAVAALHASAESTDATKWGVIADLYDRLYRKTGSPVVRLNGAVAVAMADGPEAGLAMLGQLEVELADYHYFHAAQADLLARLGHYHEAVRAVERALELCQNPTERRFLVRQRTALAERADA